MCRPPEKGWLRGMSTRTKVVQFLRALGLLRASPTSPSSSERVFPDSGERSDTSDLLGSFDPFNLLVSAPSPPDQAKERRLLMQGKLNYARQAAKKKLCHLPDNQRLTYIAQVTSGLHELRHFHDYFGTTSGFACLLRTLEDGMAFHQLWSQLRQGPRIKLPLAEWGRHADAPAVLKDYLAQRRSYVEWLNLFDGSMKALRRPGTTDAGAAVLVFSLKGVEASHPAVPMNFQSMTSGKTEHRFIPLGARALFEGNAAIIQRMATTRVFGRAYAEQLKATFRSVPSDDDRGQYYMVADRYLTIHLEKFYDEFQLALTDVALMAERPYDLPTEHPGWRLTKAVGMAQDLGPIHQRPDVDLGKYMDQITSGLGWKSVKTVAEEAFARGQAELNRLDALAQENRTLWPGILRAAHALHLLFLAARKATPEILVEPKLYFPALSFWPPPPAYEDGQGIVFHGLDAHDRRAFLGWFLFEHLQRRLLFSTTLPCPLGPGRHECPGDPLTPGWQPLESCLFSRCATEMGIPKLVIERIS